MDGIIDAIENIIKFLKLAIRIVNQVLNNTKRIILYLLAILPKIGNIILTLPPYIQVFATITIGVSVAYLILGRQHGKSD